MTKQFVTEEISTDTCFSDCKVLSDFISVASKLLSRYGDVPVKLDAGGNIVQTVVTIQQGETYDH